MRNRKDPEMESRLKKMEAMLWQGYSVLQVASSVDNTPKAVYAFARRHGLPFNAHFKPGGGKEKELVYMVACNYPIEAICRRFRIAPIVIERTLERIAQIGPTQCSATPPHTAAPSADQTELAESRPLPSLNTKETSSVPSADSSSLTGG